MIQDWSLRGKILRIYDAFGKVLNKKINGEGRYNSNSRALYGYRKKDIETLRKELIDKCHSQMMAIDGDNKINAVLKTYCKFYPNQMIHFIN
jgi:hypothetical protein